MNAKMITGIITSVLAATGVGGGVLYDRSDRDLIHDDIRQDAAVIDTELNLRIVELELKHLRTIEERRMLSPDEADRRDYLNSLREVLIAEQRG